jgi:hypothetical protein
MNPNRASYASLIAASSLRAFACRGCDACLFSGRPRRRALGLRRSTSRSANARVMRECLEPIGFLERPPDVVGDTVQLIERRKRSKRDQL